MPVVASSGNANPVTRNTILLELELLQTQMTQKPMLRAEVYAHAIRANQNFIHRKCEVRLRWTAGLKVILSTGMALNLWR